MTNPTSNFGWQMPTSTDLVTDLPADFETFGQAVDTTLAELKGGTTGQILSKTSNTDMDFTWVTNDVGDITAVTAGTGISGGGTSGAVTITNSMATEIAAKGDLIVGTGSQTFDNLGVGTNGQVLTADSTAATGLKWATSGGGTSIAAATDYVSTTENTTSSSYTGLTTASSVTVTTGTKALVSISAIFDNAAGVNVQGYMSFAVSGATTIASTDTRAVGMNYLASAGGNFKFRSGGTFVITGLTAGSNTFTTQFKKMGGDTPYFGERSISVIDLGS